MSIRLVRDSEPGANRSGPNPEDPAGAIARRHAPARNHVGPRPPGRPRGPVRPCRPTHARDDGP
ncbi:hypothetical protein MOPEL_078_00640 [Mobilicoccus pelagius NBRC 104925]|uniref:Uncharacterized protein n=1 Tax=Mobilicoccus pelagius NBRC 104925 TaxID=1089455 RepID=H5USG7_9MICO|nr:hypothetical protein MOPEL_078_00640 [Mobilicoccus pelagius NBRC 104925]